MAKRSKKLAELIDATDTSIVKLEETHASVKKEADTYERGYRTRYEIVPLMQEVRASVDAYEELASKCFYKLPTYQENQVVFLILCCNHFRFMVYSLSASYALFIVDR